MSETRQFLDALFGGIEEPQRIVLWRLAARQSIACESLNDAAKITEGKADVYVHVGTTSRQIQRNKRITIEAAETLVGLWADVDFADSVHTRAGLPPDADAAAELIRLVPVEPSIVVHSGHGLQAWWLFSEPWVFDGLAEHHEAQVLAKAWQVSLERRAAERGWTVDSLGDLARVLRVPGTMNTKRVPHVPVSMLSCTDRRYAREDLEAVLLDGCWDEAERRISQRNGVANGVGLTVDLQASPPLDLLEGLREIDPEFDAVWRRKVNAARRAWTQSEWDLSLARRAVLAGWRDEDVLALIVAHRRKSGEKEKKHAEYYEKTLRAAHSTQDQEAALAAIASTAALPADEDDADEAGDTGGEVSGDARDGLVARISTVLGIPIARITRSRGLPGVYALETKYGNGEIGGVEALTEQAKFRRACADVAGLLPKRLKASVWDNVAQLMLRSLEIVDYGPEATVEGHAETLLSLYLAENPPWTTEEIEKASPHARELDAVRMRPWVDGDTVYLFSAGFQAWAATTRGMKMQPREIAGMMRSWGGEVERMHFTVKGRATTRSVWSLRRDNHA